MAWIFKASLILFAFSFFLYPHAEEEDTSETLIIWDVGQGQMLTYVNSTHCHHLDMGGEFFPEESIFDLCHLKKNQLTFSHLDQDHINFVTRVYRILPSLCRTQQRPFLFVSNKKRRKIQNIPLCLDNAVQPFKEVSIPQEIKPRNSNEESRIFVLKQKVLIPGDSTSRMEKHWALLLPKSIQLLILGHHGSKTSTSEFLLNQLPSLHLSVVSARKRRYSHPHPQIVSRLNKRGVLLVGTEQFHHVEVDLKEERLKALPFIGDLE